jgi:hypothetical protein
MVLENTFPEKIWTNRGEDRRVEVITQKGAS